MEALRVKHFGLLYTVQKSGCNMLLLMLFFCFVFFLSIYFLRLFLSLLSRPGHEVPRLRMYGTIPPFPQDFFMAWYLGKHRDFTSTFLLSFLPFSTYRYMSNGT